MNFIFNLRRKHLYYFKQAILEYKSKFNSFYSCKNQENKSMWKNQKEGQINMRKTSPFVWYKNPVTKLPLYFWNIYIFVRYYFLINSFLESEVSSIESL